MIKTGRLGSGESWTSEEELGLYWLPPLPGEYLLAARYQTYEGSVQAETRRLNVAEAGLTAAGATLERSSELLLVHAWADERNVWLRIAPGGYPLAPRWLLPAGTWPGGGDLRVAQHGFSPLSDPPIPAYRFWIVWLSGNRIGGAFVDHQGQILAHLDTTVTEIKEGVLLTPIQHEDGELLLPMATREDSGTSISWYRVGPSGSDVTPWTQWSLPPDAEQLSVTACPDGTVALVWCDRAGRRVFAQHTRMQRTQPSKQEVAAFSDGRIVHVAVTDTRKGVSLVLVRRWEKNEREFITVHSRGGRAPSDSGPIELPRDRAAKDFRTVEVPRFGPVVLQRDHQGNLWTATATGGATWNPVQELNGSKDFGIAAGTSGVIVWAADPKLGLRFAPVSLF